MQNLNSFKRIGLDSNIFIYYLDRNSQVYSQADNLISRLTSGNFKVITSVLTLIEILSYKIPPKLIKQAEKDFSEIPNITLSDVTSEIGKTAARIRRERGLKLVDAVQLATAVVSNCEVFITNDFRLKRFKEVKVLLLQEIKV